MCGGVTRSRACSTTGGYFFLLAGTADFFADGGGFWAVLVPVAAGLAGESGIAADTADAADAGGGGLGGSCADTGAAASRLSRGTFIMIGGWPERCRVSS